MRVPEVIKPKKKEIAVVDDKDLKWTIFEQHVQGKSIIDLAKRYKKAPKTIAKWIKQARLAYSGYLEKQSGLDLMTMAVAENDMLKKMTMDKMVAMQEAGVSYDDDGNEVIGAHFDHEAYSRYLKIAASIIQKKNEMLMKMGALPTTAEKIHHTVTGELKIKPETSEEETRELRSAEEIQRDIDERLKKTRRLTVE